MEGWFISWLNDRVSNFQKQKKRKGELLDEVKALTKEKPKQLKLWLRKSLRDSPG